MFSKSKRVIGVALAALMIASAFAGCGDEKTPGESQAGDSSAASQVQEVKAVTVDEMLADAELALGDEGKDSAITLKVWAPNEAVDVFKKQCDDFVSNFPDRKITIEVIAQSESDAASTLMNDPEAAADVFGFASDHATKLFPDKFVSKVRKQFVQPIKDTNLSDCVDTASYQGKDDSQPEMYAYPETGDNGYILYYNKSLISEEEVGSMESILEVCKEKDKDLIINMGDGFYACMVPITGGGTFSVDENRNQVLNYDYEKIAPVAKAFSNLLAGNDHYVNDDPNKVLAAGLKNETALAGVVGPWKTKAMKGVLGDNYGVAKLPTINVDGTDTQIVNMFGYKLLGVNTNTKSPMTSHSLAYYLSSEKCQQERMEKLEWGPSITSLIESDAVKNDPTFSALYAQREFSIPQTGLAGSFWDPTAGFGKYLVTKDNDLSDAGIEKAFNDMVDNITTTVSE